MAACTSPRMTASYIASVSRNRAWLAALLILSLPFALMLHAQDPSADRIQALERELRQQKHTLADYGGLNRYGSDDAELRPPAKGEDRVIFLGDQITEFWGHEDGTFFPGKPWLNRGIAGQTTDQMLIRFRQDVIALEPKAVLILGGLNDVAGIHTPSSEELVLDNLKSMTELAQAHGIRVVIASLTPVCDCFVKGGRQRLQGRISELNQLIREYCAQADATYLDYYAALVSGRDFKKELTKDGVVPNEAGYGLMANLASKAIAEALKK